MSKQLQKKIKVKKNTDETKLNVFLSKLFNIRNNTMRMLSDRGYGEFIKKFYADISYNKFEKLYSKQDINLNVYKKQNNKLYQCIVYFVDQYSNVGRNKAQFMKLVNTIEQTFDKDADIITLMMVVQDDGVNGKTKGIEKYLSIYKKQYLEKQTHKAELIPELFYYSELSSIKIDHKLVPEHILIDDNEIKKVLEEYNCTKDQLPKINKTDPISKYYGAQVGQVFKIIRKSITSGITISYRTVIPA